MFTLGARALVPGHAHRYQIVYVVFRHGVPKISTSLNPVPPGLFWSSWAWGGGGASKAPPPPTLHKSESIDAIVMKLGG